MRQGTFENIMPASWWGCRPGDNLPPFGRIMVLSSASQPVTVMGQRCTCRPSWLHQMRLWNPVGPPLSPELTVATTLKGEV